MFREIESKNELGSDSFKVSFNQSRGSPYKNFIRATWKFIGGLCFR